MKSSAQYSPEAMATWRATLLEREAKYAERLEETRQRALQRAGEAATRLRAEFGATRVELFGSLAHGGWWSESSDVDLAVWGLTAENHLVALSRLNDQHGPTVDVVRMERCPLALRAPIEKDGVAI